ncbi:unnamed protein product [Arabis nemorensis]|uniref:TRF2/HOY1 PH-like domain-containing protein n=1 Tax=Arabis nemorensis TaxID=586526 RepID=A0A565AXF5_9BRAS|nr:unnamed protein product [Arabis nemorensis]
MSSEDEDRNLTVAQAQTTAASVASPAVASSSQPLGLDLCLDSTPLGSDLSLGLPSSTLQEAQAQTTAASVASPAVASSSRGPRALNFSFTKITIGDWTQDTASSGDLMAKCFFGKRQLVWELLVELREPPKFFIENDDPLADTKWIPIEYFTQNHPSSIDRRHELHFDPKVLETNINKIVTSDIFWSTLAPYPSLAESTFFVAGAGDQDASRKRKEREE